MMSVRGQKILPPMSYIATRVPTRQSRVSACVFVAHLIGDAACARQLKEIRGG
jgi:hypothetical protein